MSKILMNVTMFHTKLLVNTYTALTLPFYAIYQKPWRQIKLSKMCRVNTTIKNGQIIWTRKGEKGNNPVYNYSTYLEAFEHLNKSKVSVGIRQILDENIQYDKRGNPVVIDGKILKKIVLSDKYRWLTIGEVIERVDNIAKGLAQMGVKKNDRVIIFAEAQANWFFCSMAVAKLGAVVVTLFSNLGTSGVVYGMNQTKAQFVITNEDLKNKMLTYLDKVPDVKNIIYFKNRNKENSTKEEIPTLESIKIKSLDELKSDGSKIKSFKFEYPGPDDMALIMYTSGTTSLPKAVMITHRQLMANIKSMTHSTEENGISFDNLTLASFLPLSHIFGFVFNLFIFINEGQIGFATPFTLLNSSPSHVPGQVGDLNLIKPNIFVVVPLVLERFQKEIYATLNKRSSLAAPLFTYFMDYKTRWLARGFQTPIINRLICSKVKEQFGGNLELVGIGGAPLHPTIQTFTKAALDVVLVNAYGCTETCGGVTMMHKVDLSVGNVGVPLEGVQAKLVDWPEGGYTTKDKPYPRGEIVIGGQTVCTGYYQLDQETKEAFFDDENGVRWFCSGDIAEIEPQTGKIRIVDRKKDLAKLANGEYVSLGKIESALRSSRYIENICICTSMFSNNLAALISPNPKVLKGLARSLNKGNLSIKEMCQDPIITENVLKSIDDTGKRSQLSQKEVPAIITLTAEEWTPENNLLTAAFKLKRKNVNDFYKKDIQRMFDTIK